MSSDSRLQPEVDYLTKDFESFRRVLLDHLTEDAPVWKGRHPADPVLTVAEVLAYAADLLSYHQDAVATEAYLGTARLRSSVRRHARLLGDSISEGCNARVWIQVQPVNEQVFPAGTVLRAGEVHTVLTSAERPPRGGVYFETLHDAALRPDHTALSLAADLAVGAREGSLAGEVQGLKAGMVLALLQRGERVDRHALRLTEVVAGGGRTLLKWAAADAPTVRYSKDRTRVLGNLVLADHGLSSEITLPPVPEGRDYRPELPVSELCFREDVSYEELERRPAAIALVSDPHRCLPAITLLGSGIAANRQPRRWTPLRDLVAAGPADAEFVVEVEEGGASFLLFGQGDAGLSPDPGATFRARLREGRGLAGNVGPDTEFLVYGAPGAGVVRATNPLAAQGGQEAEPTEAVRQRAPRQVFRQERLLNASDFGDAVLEVPGVRAVSVAEDGPRQFQVVVEPAAPWAPGQPLPPELESALRVALDPRVILGSAYTLATPTREAVTVRLRVRLAAGAREETVLAAVRQAVETWGATRRLGLKGALYSSAIVAIVLGQPGVEDVELLSFRKSSDGTPGDILQPAPGSILDLDFARGPSILLLES